MIINHIIQFDHHSMDCSNYYQGTVQLDIAVRDTGKFYLSIEEYYE
jgi:hypothetical protein